MLERIEHRYVAEVLPANAASITTSPLDLDWVPAIEWAHWQRIRRCEIALASAPGPARILPQWDAEAGAPYLSKLAVAFDDAEPERAEEIPLRYVASAVQREVSGMVATGRIKEGAPLTWRVCAYPVPQADPIGLEETFRIAQPMTSPSPLASCSLPTMLRNATRHGADRTPGEPIDVPVFFASKVLEEASTGAMRAGEREAGGVLLGRVLRDMASSELVVEVVAQLPAREAVADDASLRFTPETWKAVHGAISLRRAGEQVVGWYHSHPVKWWPCRACPPQRRERCPSNRAFFSAMDVGFHRTAFQGALNIALLLSFHGDTRPRFDVFGWREGIVAARDYYIAEEVA